QLHVVWEQWMPTAQANYVLKDMLGRTLRQWEAKPGVGQQELSLDAVPAGVYTLQLQSRGQLLGIARVVVQ
ncbi:MAG: T9SS C-terminal target domain-containing protein, partial [Bacteroidetes bacterium]